MYLFNVGEKTMQPFEWFDVKVKLKNLSRKLDEAKSQRMDKCWKVVVIAS